MNKYPLIWAQKGMTSWGFQIGPLWAYVPFRQFGGIWKTRVGVAR